MDRDVRNGSREETMEEKAARAFDSLAMIDMATRNGCPPHALQDIVGNLLVLLAWFDETKCAPQSPAPATDRRARALVVDCLAKAGVPPHALPGSLGLLGECMRHDGLFVGIDAEPVAPTGTPD